MSNPSTIDVVKGQLYGIEVPTVDEAHQAQRLVEAKNDLRTKLKHGVWIVEFKKVDGTPSIMECTLDGRYLPPGDPQDTGSKAAVNPTVLRVYAVDRAGWRSFKVLNVTKVYLRPESL